jgi:hypothetical protein
MLVSEDEGIIILRKTQGNTRPLTQPNISGDMHLQYRIIRLFKNSYNCSAVQLIKFMYFSMDMNGFHLACIQGPNLSPKRSVKYQYLQYRRPVNLIGYKILLFYNVNCISMLFEMLLLILILTLRCQTPNFLYFQLFVNRTNNKKLKKSDEKCTHRIFLKNIVDNFQKADIQDGRKELTWI